MKQVYFLLSAICLFKISTAQRIDTTLLAYSEKYEPERLYLQFDKPTYAPGETVWFKAYLMAGVLPSENSKTFYADVYNESGRLLAHSLFPVIEGGAAGSYTIPDSLAGTVLHIRAYTAWMLNFDTVFLYKKDIPVVQKEDAGNSDPVTADPSIRFFPEGGDAIEGLPSRIAFAANDAYERPVTVKGVIVDSKGAVADTIRTEHDGMGSVHLTYTAGEKYAAKWYDEQNNLHTTALPSAKASGVCLEIKSVSGKKLFVIRRSEEVPDNMKQLHVVATQHQQLVYSASVDLSGATNTGGVIPTGGLVSGILQVTVLGSDWKPLAERICFINNNDAVLRPEISFLTLKTNKRGANTLQISLPDSVTANLSVSITDKSIGADSSNNIISRLLFEGSLRGRIYNPQYYVSGNSEEVSRHFDLVMMTHGWRRFNWTAIAAGEMPQMKHPAETDYLTFSGKVYGIDSAQISNSGGLVAILRGIDSSQRVLSINVKPNGTFADTNIVLFDSARIYYQFGNKVIARKSELRFMNTILPAGQRISIESVMRPVIDTSGFARIRYLSSEEARLNQLLKTATLTGVTVKTKSKSAAQKLDDQYVSGMFKGGDAYQFDLINDPVASSYRDLFLFLQGRVAGLQIDRSGAVTNVTWRGSTPAIYLNEMEIDSRQLSTISMSNLAYIKVFRPPFMGGRNGSGGAIALYMKKGADHPADEGQGIPSQMIYGYTAVREFYSPDYATQNPRNDAQDLRSTLYWLPAILTSPQQRTVKFTFYNNDITSAFRVVLEGMSTDGRLVHIEKVFE